MKTDLDVSFSMGCTDVGGWGIHCYATVGPTSRDPNG